MARMFDTLGVALYCLLGTCPVFVAGTGREMSSLYIDELTYRFINTNIPTRIWHPCLNYASITSRSVSEHSVPECAGFSSIPP